MDTLIQVHAEVVAIAVVVAFAVGYVLGKTYGYLERADHDQ
jgi:hypothetical protein